MSGATTGFFVTSGGSILEMDIPREGTSLREIFDGQLEKGDLRPIDADQVEKIVVSTDRVAVVGGGFEEVDTYVWRQIVADDEPDAEKPLEKMTKAELEALAEAQDPPVDLSDAKNNDDRVAAIKAAQG